MFGVLILVGSAGAFDLRDSRYGGLGRSVLMSRPTAVNLVNTAGDNRNLNGGQIEAGYNRRFELADLDYLFVAGAWKYRQVTFAFGAAQFGKTDLYAEQTLKGSVTLRYHRFALGLAPSVMQVQIGNNYGTLRAATVGAGVSYAASTFKVGLVADNLTRPALLERGAALEPNYTLLTEYCGRRAFSITGRVKFEDLQKPQFGLGQWIRLSGRSAFFWGVAGEPTEYGGGIEVDVPFGSATYAVAIHPVLGLTHTITLSAHARRTEPAREGEFD
jgi:hypothetical protein